MRYIDAPASFCDKMLQHLLAHQTELGKKTGNRVLNIAADSFRQPGSCIKPLSCYAPAIELDYYYWSSYLPNYGIYLKKMGSVWPTNYGGNPGDIEDLRTLQQALAPSLMTIPARIVDTLSPSRSYFFLRDVFKLSTLTQADADYAPAGGQRIRFLRRDFRKS